MARRIEAKWLQITVIVGDDNSFEVRADESASADPTNASYFVSRSTCRADSIEFLKEILSKVNANYCQDSIRLCVEGTRILREKACQSND